MWWTTSAPRSRRSKRWAGTSTASDVTSDGGGWAYAEDSEHVPLVVFRPYGGDHADSDALVSGDVAFVFVQEDMGAVRALLWRGARLGAPQVHPGSHYFDSVEHVGVFDENAAFGTDHPASVRLFLEVPALRPAIARLVDLGGHAEPTPQERDMGPYFSVTCTDDQGTTFGLVSTELD